MKLTQQQIEDRLLEALLHEQNRSDKDHALTEIESALDTGFNSNSSQAHPSWAKRLGTIAASAAVGGLVVFGITSIQKSKQVPQLATRDAPPEKSDEERQRELDLLKRAVREQEDKVEERRKVLATILRPRKAIYYTREDNIIGEQDDQFAQSAAERYHKLEQEKMQLTAQIEGMLKYTNEELMIYAAGLNFPENVIKTLHPQYLELKGQVETLRRQGLGDNHPTVVSTISLIEQMKRQLDEGIIGLRATLHAQLDLADERLMQAKAVKDGKKEEFIKRGLSHVDYDDAKHDLEADQNLLQAMKLELKLKEEMSRQSDIPPLRNPNE